LDLPKPPPLGGTTSKRDDACAERSKENHVNRERSISHHSIAKNDN